MALVRHSLISSLVRSRLQTLSPQVIVVRFLELLPHIPLSVNRLNRLLRRTGEVGLHSADMITLIVGLARMNGSIVLFRISWTMSLFVPSPVHSCSVLLWIKGNGLIKFLIDQMKLKGGGGYYLNKVFCPRYFLSCVTNRKC